MQRTHIRDKQKKLIGEAERTLAENKLLSPQTVSYLAAIDPAFIKAASAQLAITVLQARQALQFARFSRNEIGGKAPSLPITFAKAGLDPSSAYARKLLLQELCAAPDISLPEDGKPDLSRIEFKTPPQKLEGSLASRFMRRAIFLTAPYFLIRDRIVAGKVRLETAPPVTVEGMKPVADLLQSIGEYETSAEGKQYPLDLPALRGWQ